MSTPPSPSRTTGLANHDTLPSVGRLLEESLRAHRPAQHRAAQHRAAQHRAEPNELHLEGGSIYPAASAPASSSLPPPRHPSEPPADLEIDGSPSTRSPAASRAISTPPPTSSPRTPRRGPRVAAILVAAFALGSLTTLGLTTPSSPSPPVMVAELDAPVPGPAGVSLAPATLASDPPSHTCDGSSNTDGLVSLEVDLPPVSRQAPVDVQSVSVALDEPVTGTATDAAPSTEAATVATDTAAPFADAKPTATSPEETKDEAETTSDGVASKVTAFDTSRARAALGTVAASAQAQCATRSGRAALQVTFAPTGRVTSAVVAAGSLQGTSAGSCVARVARGASVPAHGDGYVTVKRVVRLHAPTEAPALSLR